ncbi:Uncharacterised protein [Raoultella terrigena]|uniref:Uncharacterized protein n=1 Tax=Raoultella terrigena TaxID=577 RepID=A0A3P8KWF8_RAOTE|nr:Uncharacterised protein [Raoultella terrigena]
MLMRNYQFWEVVFEYVHHPLLSPFLHMQHIYLNSLVQHDY